MQSVGKYGDEWIELKDNGVWKLGASWKDLISIGTWEQKGDQICFIPAGHEDEEEEYGTLIENVLIIDGDMWIKE